MLKDLIDIKSLDKFQITDIIDMAKRFENGMAPSTVEGKTAVMIFCENSTRTKCSFELACQRLKMNILNFESATSSFSKGESLKDTLDNLYFIGADVAIIRHSKSNIIDEIDLKYPLQFVNAGDGNHAHPTQALLDYYTMIEKLGSVEGKKIVIVGDVAHSRVAKSNIELLNKFGAIVTICCPEYFAPSNNLGVEFQADLQIALKNADVVMLLRVQKERHASGFPESEYIKNYQLNSDILNKIAPDAILMHPGPVNREVELTSELLDSKKGETILEQAKNGVFIRMAVLNTILGGVK